MKKETVKKPLGNLPQIRDYICTALILTVAAILCWLMIEYSVDRYVELIFVLAVTLISRLTNGYLCGLIASVISMFAVNYAFTYPYYNFNFTIAGYPVTFCVFLLVSVIISMATTQMKEQSKIQSEMEKEKMRGNLLRSVSHDIRTPLTSISGAASAILENHTKLDEGDVIKLVVDIKNDAQWLIRMVENILTVTRIGDETGELKKNLEAAEEIISESVMKFHKRYDVPVKISIPDELMLIPMDAVLIEQVIINIMENSILHGKSTTEITLSLSERDGFAVFDIADNGKGITEKAMNNLFKEYLISPSSQGDSKRNMGIGLSVCMTIIKAHGGTMYGDNKADGGAVFTFTLPMS